MANFIEDYRQVVANPFKLGKVKFPDGEEVLLKIRMTENRKIFCLYKPYPDDPPQKYVPKSPSWEVTNFSIYDEHPDIYKKSYKSDRRIISVITSLTDVTGPHETHKKGITVTDDGQSLIIRYHTYSPQIPSAFNDGIVLYAGGRYDKDGALEATEAGWVTDNHTYHKSLEYDVETDEVISTHAENPFDIHGSTVSFRYTDDDRHTMKVNLQNNSTQVCLPLITLTQTLESPQAVIDMAKKYFVKQFKQTFQD